MAKSYASSTTIPLAVIPNPMRRMAFLNVDAVKRDADRKARRASSSISTLPQMGWSKGNRLDLAQIGRMFES
jgi:transposase